MPRKLKNAQKRSKTDLKGASTDKSGTDNKAPAKTFDKYGHPIGTIKLRIENHSWKHLKNGKELDRSPKTSRVEVKIIQSDSKAPQRIFTISGIPNVDGSVEQSFPNAPRTMSGAQITLKVGGRPAGLNQTINFEKSVNFESITVNLFRDKTGNSAKLEVN